MAREMEIGREMKREKKGDNEEDRERGETEMVEGNSR
jgi:hypothetical protein